MRSEAGLHTHQDEGLPNPDARYFIPGSGIAQVPKERWNKAQSAEESLWLTDGVWWRDDRNFSHKENFDNYAVIKDLNFEHALEIGCGPFTNLRLIAEEAKIKKVSLLDPLILSYLNHPACRYTHKKLIVDPNWPPTWLVSIANKLMKLSPKFSGLFSRLVRYLCRKNSLPIGSILSIPAEELSFKNEFDLVTFINVLEHCFDAHKIFDNILQSLKPGGILILHERLYSTDKNIEWYDAYHPLRVGEPIVRDFITKNFKVLYQLELEANSSPEELWPQIFVIAKKV